MERFLTIIVFATVFMTTSGQAANATIFFTNSAEPRMTDDLGSSNLNLRFSPGYNVDNTPRYDLSLFPLGIVEFGKVNGISSPIDSGLFELTFKTHEYYDSEKPITPFTLYTVTESGLADIKKNEEAFDLGSIEKDQRALNPASKEELGYQFKVALGFDVSQTTILTAEYRYLGYDEPDVLNPHGFVLGVRFLF